MLTDEEIRSKITDLGGDAIHIRGAGAKWEVILKPPQLKDWEFFLANQNNPATKSLAGYKVVRSMIAYPSLDEFDTLRKRWVGMAEAIQRHPSFDRFIGLEVEAAEKE